MFKRFVVLSCSVMLLLAACSTTPLVPAAPNTPPVVPTSAPTATAVPPVAAPAPTSAAPDPVAPALNNHLPDSCTVAGQQTYVNAFDGYCFAYPSRFELKTAPTGQPQLFGPALDQNLDALRASMALEVEVAVKDARWSEIVDRYVQQFAGMNLPAITRTPIELGGEPAEMLEVVPGREGSRDVFILHDGTLYHFMFMPSVRDFPQAKNDVEELYQAVTQSFAFTSKKPRPLLPSFEGVPVFFGPLSLVLPPGLASGISGNQFPHSEGQDLPYWEVTPGHSVLKLEGYLLQGKSHQPQIYVYPAQAYAEMVPGAFESIRRLDNILYGPDAPISVDQLPAVPFFNAQQTFASNIQKTSFQNGGGVRFVTEYAQYPASVNNTDLFYQFQGVTRDGAYYIIAILPINNPALAATSDGGAVLPAGGVPYPDITAPNPDMPGYYSAVTNLLNAQSPEAFAPTINQLDSLIQSMRITP